MFLSHLFTGDPLLEQIANDRDRISTTRNPRAPAVRLVQLALLTWDPDCLPSGADGGFGNESAGAVRRFKIEELGISPDDPNLFSDVGPQTVIRLDQIQAAAEAPPEPAPVSCAQVVGTPEALGLLATADLMLVRTSATDLGDGRFSVVVYAAQPMLDLLNASFEVTVLETPEMLQARWDTVQSQVE